MWWWVISQNNDLLRTYNKRLDRSKIQMTMSIMDVMLAQQSGNDYHGNRERNICYIKPRD